MDDDSTASAMTHDLRQFPASLFGSVMGVTGLSLVWRSMHMHFQSPAWIADALAVVAVAAFVVIGTAYAAKIAMAPEAVRAEFEHPIAGNTFATFWVSLLLLPMILAPFSLWLARALWLIGAVGMTVQGWLIVTRWLTQRHERAHATPAWILPVVGLLDLPLAVPVLGWPQLHGAMEAGLAIGLFFAIPVLTLVLARLIFEEPLPHALQPTLMILAAPTGVGVSSYVATTGEVDLFARSLFAVTLFLLPVLLGRLRHLSSCCPFKFGWWAVSFPMAACAASALRVAQAEPGWATEAIALALTGLSTIVITWLICRTVSGVARGELRTLSA
ncbi:SLAC1 anion channel family protein [Rubrivivax sp. RP6-9]|uniref:SLAC1 anion channel family protein n=1 Tax=Rubrivivax sp. RP6-9 TaxID=3415750 RepID=UPI003CC64FB9